MDIGSKGEDGLSLAELLLLFIRNLRLFATVVGIGALAGLLFALLMPAKYTVEASFLPQVSGNSASALAGVAAQFGIGVAAEDPTQSPAFYTTLIGSDQLLGRLADTDLRDSTASSTPLYLADHYGLAKPGRDPAVVRVKVIRKLRDKLLAVANRQTGMVVVTFEDQDRDLAVRLVGRVLAFVNEFNVSTRQTQARAEREFIQGRKDTAEADLAASSGRLEAFLSRNRDYHSSPSLQAQYDRLSQDVSMRQSLYASITQNYEQARIDQVRNTPVITVVEAPARPAIPDSRRIAVRLIMGGMLGFFLGVAWVAGRGWLARASTQHPALMAEMRATLQGLRRRTA